MTPVPHDTGARLRGRDLLGTVTAWIVVVFTIAFWVMVGNLFL